MAQLNLRLGYDVVIDAVNDSEEARQTWPTAAEAYGAELAFVHLVIADAWEHERRLLGTARGHSRVVEPTWADVQRRRAEYAPWVDDHHEIDTASRSVVEIANDVITQVAST